MYERPELTKEKGAVGGMHDITLFNVGQKRSADRQ